MEFIDALGIPVERMLGICFLIVLGIGAAACIFGTSSIRNMPGRKITGWLALGSIILILIFPYCERNPEWLDRLVGDNIILILIFGPLSFYSTVIVPSLSIILLSRALTYIFKSTPAVISWISAIFFGSASSVLYMVLFWFSFRFVEGERGMAVAAYSLVGGIVTGIIFLFVNIIENLNNT